VIDEVVKLMISETMILWCLLWQCNYCSQHELIITEISSEGKGFPQKRVRKRDLKNSCCEVSRETNRFC